MPEESRLGDTIENYRLVRVLGTGSTSVVYLGQRLDDRQAVVAIKVLTFDDAAKPSERANFHIRFLQEARAASKLRHDHILPVLSYGDADGLTYMIMPVVTSGTLGDLLASYEGPLPLADISEYLHQLASALDFAHQRGVVHRDVKPSNMLVDEHGQVYLTDFGIAHLFEAHGNALTRSDRQGYTALTRTGEVLGTPYYMSPEQIKSEPIGPAADIYALGVVVYQLVTGQVPYIGDTAIAVAMQHLQEAACPPALLRQDLPEPAEAAILRAIEKQPSDRFPTAGAFARAFADGLRPADEREAGMSANATRLHMLPVSSDAASEPALARSGNPGRKQVQDLVGEQVGPYHLEALLETGELGAVFAARTSSGAERVRLRMLTVEADQSPEASSLPLARFQQLARDVTALQHPHLLQLIDYGSFQGSPYLVTPQAPAQSLAERLAVDGPLDLSVVGRYLDQIVAALEYAHGHDLLHLHLTSGNVFLDQGGHCIVADVEVLRLLELCGQRSLDNRLIGLAPEQLRGDRVDTYTDVYALGAVLYEMLTAHPMFSGNTREEIARQHLHATIPPLRRWRGALPAGLETILAQALTKEPSQRFRRPGELSKAYHQLIARTRAEQPSVHAQAPAVSFGRRGEQLLPADAQTVDVGDRDSLRAHAQTSPLDQGTPEAPTGPAAPTEPPLPRERGDGGGLKFSLPAFIRARPLQNMLVLVLVLVLIAGTVVLIRGYPARHLSHTGPSRVATAQAFFLDDPEGTPGHTDEVQVDVTGLAAAARGDEYDVWLTNLQSEHFLALGTLVPQGGSFALTYPGSGGSPGMNLLAAGTGLEITLEHGPVQAPAGPIVLRGTFPPDAFVHIKHLLVAFPSTPNQIGLLIGLRNQVQLLDGQALELQDGVAAQDTLAIQCRAQGIVDIIEGNQGPDYQPLQSDCISANIVETGDGFGLLQNGNNAGYLGGVADHATLAAQAPDATNVIKTNAQHVEICVSNIEGWVQTIDHDAVNLIQNPTQVSRVDEIVTLSDRAFNGQSLSPDGNIGPVPGEGGTKTANRQGQLMATLTLIP